MNTGSIAGFMIAISARAVKESKREGGVNGIARTAFWDGALKTVEKIVDVAEGEDPKEALDSMARDIDDLIGGAAHDGN